MSALSSYELWNDWEAVELEVEGELVLIPFFVDIGIGARIERRRVLMLGETFLVGEGYVTKQFASADIKVLPAVVGGEAGYVPLQFNNKTYFGFPGYIPIERAA